VAGADLNPNTAPTPVAADALRRTREDPDRVVVVDSVRRMTRAELLREATQVASALRRRGLAPGDALAFQLPNWHEACVIHLAAALQGWRLVPLLPMYREAELRLIFSETHPQAVFVPESFRKVRHADLLQRSVAGQLPAERVFVLRGEQAPFARYADLLRPETQALDACMADADEVQIVLYTSGSTGKPKGVLHTHRTMGELISFSGGFWGLDDADVAFVPSPIGHIGGAMYAFEFPWRLGLRAVLMDTWEADAAVDLIDREGATFCAGATPFLADLLAAARRRDRRLPSLARFVCGGASVPPSLVEQASQWFEGCTVSRAYGSTEVPVICPGVSSRVDAWHGARTDGECAADVQLLDDNGLPVAEGEVGEIVARAPRMFAGYLNPADAQGAYTADGYFRMGDLGRRVEGRFLEIVGRKKDLIIRLGENISPLEVENVLVEHPAVRQVAIVGVPDSRTGEAAMAWVVPVPGAQPTLSELCDFLAQRGLARQKHPERLRIVQTLPTNSMGKVLKRELQGWAMQEVIAMPGAEDH